MKSLDMIIKQYERKDFNFQVEKSKLFFPECDFVCFEYSLKTDKTLGNIYFLKNKQRLCGYISFPSKIIKETEEEYINIYNLKPLNED